MGLFDCLILFLHPSKQISVMSGLPQLNHKQGYFAQGHNAIPPVRLESATPPSRVKHSTTKPLRSLINGLTIFVLVLYFSVL